MASRSRRAKADLIAEIATRSLNRARAWRFVLATRLLGIRPMDDQASEALRDLYDGVLVMRCEVEAIRDSLIAAGITTPDELMRRMGEAAEGINGIYEAIFPGLWVDDEGTIRYDESGIHQPEQEGGAPN